MDFEEIKNKVKETLKNSKPIIQKLTEEKIIPAAKTFAYKILQKKTDVAINRLLALKEKALKETDETTKNNHLIGLKLGAEALIAIGEKLIQAGKYLLEG